MPTILYWLSLYLFSVSIFLLFFRCVGYYDEPHVKTYTNEISDFYDKFFARLAANGHKVSCLAYSSSLAGSIYRHSLCKSYLLNTKKLTELDFTIEETSRIEELIIPGFMERVSLFNHLNIVNILLVVNLGVFVGSVI